MRRLLSALLLLALAILGFASRADAAQLQASTAAEFDTALTTAATNNQPDTITLAAGTYADTFTYNDPEALEIVGAGPTTILQATPSVGDVLLVIGSGTKRIADLRVNMPSAGPNPNSTAIETTNATVEDVTVTADATVTGNGLHLHGGTVRDVTVSGPDLSRGIYGSDGAVTVETSETSGPSSGLEGGSATAVITASRLRLLNANTGVHSAFSATVNVTDTLITLDPATGQRGLSSDDNNNSSAHTSELNAERVTVIGAGTDTGAVATSTGGADAMSVTVRDSVFTGVSDPFACDDTVDGSADVVAHYVNHPGTGNDDTCVTGGIVENNTVPGVPAFVDAGAGDYRPAAGSILIDSGDPADLAGLPLDLAGVARPNDGDGDCVLRRDLGAYEFHRTQLVANASAPATGTVGQPVAFSSAGSCSPEPGDVLSYEWSFDDGGTAFEADPLHTFSSAGARTGTLTVNDDDGLSATDSATVDVSAPSAGGASTGTGTGSGTTTGAGTSAGTATAAPPVVVTTAAAGDRTPPRVTRLRIRGRRVTFVLSEAARVVIRIGRRTVRVNGRRGTNRVRVPRAVRRGRHRLTLVATDRAGNRSVTLRRRFSLP